MWISIYIVLFYRSSKPALQLCSGSNPPQLEKRFHVLQLKNGVDSELRIVTSDSFDFLSFLHTSTGQDHLEKTPSKLRGGSKGWGFVSVKLFFLKKNAVRQSKVYYITSCLWIKHGNIFHASSKCLCVLWKCDQIFIFSPAVSGNKNWRHKRQVQKLKNRQNSLNYLSLSS